MADDLDALRYSVANLGAWGSWFICLACGMPTAFRDPIHVSDGRHRGTWELDDDESGALGQTGNLDGLGLDAFAGPPLLDDGSIYLDTDPAPTPWGVWVYPYAEGRIRIERHRH